MKKISILFLAALICMSVSGKSAFAQNMADYCSTPPFVGQSVSPNVLIILDNSGSMFFFAYDFSGYFSSGFTDSYPDSEYYGYFDPDKWYEYKNSRFEEQACKTNAPSSCSLTKRTKNANEWDGNFLNWLTMRRVDIARKVLVGGKAVSRSGQGNPHELIGEQPDYWGRGFLKWVNDVGNYTPYSGARCFTFNYGASSNERFKVGPSGGNCYSSVSGSTDVYNVKVWLSDEPTGVIQGVGDKVRWGLEFFNTSQGGRINTEISSNVVSSMVTAIESERPSTWTPLAEALWTATGYFAQDNTTGSNGPRYYNQDPYSYDVSDGADPFNFGTQGQPDFVRCAKSFVLIITDGEPTQDRNIPTPPKAYETTYTDGTDPVPSWAGASNPNYFWYSPNYGSHYIDDVALWSHVDYQNSQYRDLRPNPASDGTPMTGAQYITTYIAYAAFGGASPDGRTLLQRAARNGGFVDQNGNYLPDLQSEYDTDGDGVPDNYFEADDGAELEAAITAAIADILKKASSGTAVSVLTTSSRGVGSLLQAYFLPQKEDTQRWIYWTGYVQNLWVDSDDNLREDTEQDSMLKLDKDMVMKLYRNKSTYETEVGLFTTDVDGGDDGLTTSLYSCSNPTVKLFSEIDALWEAGEKLAETAPSTRTIFTSKKVIKGSTTTTISNNAFTVSNITGDSTLSAALNPDSTYTAENIVRYVRGECLETGVTGDTSCGSTVVSDFRDRRLTVNGSLKVWKLGDIINSTPKIFGSTALNTYHINYADSTYYQYVASDGYKKKSSVAFIGANDGMFHAFRVGYLKDADDSYGSLPQYVKALFKNFFTSADIEDDRLGEEMWAYIPFNSFPYLKYLADPNYCHIYFSDLTVKLVDASISTSQAITFTDPQGNPKDWASFIIGGMRFGGACSGSDASPSVPIQNDPVLGDLGFSVYFAIDITDPENPVPLWEFSDADLGYTTAYPAVIRTGKKAEQGNWYVVIASGSKQLPGSQVDIAKSTTGYIYVLNMETGELVKKIQLDHDAIVGDILAVDADKDYVSEKIYFGTSYYAQNKWKGKLVSIVIPDQVLSSSWTPSITTLFSEDYPFTASPDAVLDQFGRTWVFAGSGKYYSDVDEQDTSQQIFIGLKDVSGTSYPVGESSLYDATDVQTTGTVDGITQVCVYDSTSGNFGMENVVTSVTPTSSPVAVPTYGWKIYLEKTTNPDRAERVISRPLAVGGLVDFLTYNPSDDICDYGGDTYLYSVSYTTGVALPNISIRSPDITSDISGNVTVYKRILLGSGAPPTGEAIIIPPSKEGTLQKKIQIGTGVIVEWEDETPYSIISKIMHWLKK